MALGGVPAQPGGSAGDFDVVVVGSGSAGSPAAIAAARAGPAPCWSRSFRSSGGSRRRCSTPSTASTPRGRRPAKVVGGIGDDVVAGLRRHRHGGGAAQYLRRRDRGHLSCRASQAGVGRPGDRRRCDGPARTRSCRTPPSRTDGSPAAVATKAGLQRRRGGGSWSMPRVMPTCAITPVSDTSWPGS